ncbi:MAG: DUF4290 domain-containing protein [Mucinivorans sp.]
MAELSQKMRLLLPEYGRNVQKMVQWLFTIPDRDERSRQAALVVMTMGNVYPHKRDTEEFRHMLWDHLFMIAGDSLDIDSPFAKPAPDQFSPSPDRVPYQQKYIIQRQYGALVPRLARELTTIEDENARNKAAAFLARYMRQKSYDYNNEFPSNDLIINDLSAMTKGAIVLDPSVFNGAQIELRQQPKRNQPNQNRNKNRTINNRQGRNA